MKEFTVSFLEEDIEMLEEELENVRDLGLDIETLEEYIVHATMTHCRTMRIASSMMGYNGSVEKMLGNSENIHVGVLNMPVQLGDEIDKDEFSEYLNDVLNQAIKDFNNRNNNGPLN